YKVGSVKAGAPEHTHQQKPVSDPCTWDSVGPSILLSDYFYRSPPGLQNQGLFQ
ncbi:Hypothetical predicted protein, partial [Marmota monax]